MSQTDEFRTGVSVTTLRPALASIPDACRYLGGLSRARLYELMPQLDVIKIGSRTFITVASLDRLISASTQLPPRGKDAGPFSANDIADQPDLAAGERRHRNRTDAPLGGSR